MERERVIYTEMIERGLENETVVLPAEHPICTGCNNFVPRCQCRERAELALSAYETITEEKHHV